MPLDNCTDLHGEMTRQNAADHKVPRHLIRGEVIGSYKGLPLYDKLTDDHGVVRVYGGIVSPREVIKPGALVVNPGVIYNVA